MASNDYFMRQVEGMTDIISTMFFGRTAPEEEEEQYEIHISTDIQSLLMDLRLLIAQKRLNDAENLLFARMEEDRETSYLDCARQFYAWLGELGDRELDDCDYTRGEIAEGLEAVRRFYAGDAATRD